VKIRDAAFLAVWSTWARRATLAFVVASVAIALAVVWTTLGVFSSLWAGISQRAEQTPVLVIAPGTTHEVVTSVLSLYGAPPARVPSGEAAALNARGEGSAIPIHLGYSAMGIPILGTSIDYLTARNLVIADGTLPARPGEVVIGARAARKLGAGLGHRIRTDVPASSLQGVPVGLEVVGILAASAGPEDRVIVADLATLRWMEGALHRHGGVEATAAIELFDSLKDEDVDALHAHGDVGSFPVTAIAVWPRDVRARDLILGDYAASDQLVAVEPRRWLDEWQAVASGVRRGALLLQGLLVASAFMLVGVIAILSIRARREEWELWRQLGAKTRDLVLFLSLEWGLVIAAAALVAAAISVTARLVVIAWI
jgi:putative ABC transport system permease protein